MKNKKEKKLKQIAEKIYQLEVSIKSSNSAKQAEEEIEKLSENLSISDMMYIDEYISKKIFDK